MGKLFNAASARVAFCTVMVALTGAPAFAQGDNLGQQVITQSKAALQGIVESVAQLLQVILGLGALVTLAIVIFNVFKGEREAATKIAWWVAGLTVGFILLTVVKNLVGGV